jgi:tight adherence protein B
MTLALVTFAICLAVMLGLYWAFVVRPEDARSRELARRVERIDAVKDAVTTVSTPVSTASVVDALLSSNVKLAAGLQAFLAEAGLTWTAAGLLARSAVTAALGALMGVLLTGRGAGALLGLVTIAVPYVYVRRTRTQRLRIFEEQFPEAIDLIARSLRAGHTFTTGLGIAAEEITAPSSAASTTSRTSAWRCPMRSRRWPAACRCSTPASSSPPCSRSARPAATWRRCSTTSRGSCASVSR